MKKKIFCISILLIAISGHSQETFNSFQKEICKWKSESSSFSDCDKLISKTTISLDVSKKTISFKNIDNSEPLYFIKQASQTIDGVRKFTLISPTDGNIFICQLNLKSKEMVFLPENPTESNSKRLTYLLN
jgi:hypothetical protein